MKDHSLYCKPTGRIGCSQVSGLAWAPRLVTADTVPAWRVLPYHRLAHPVAGPLEDNSAAYNTALVVCYLECNHQY
jgi:hypothetical protein